jgi:AAA domain
MKAIGAVLLIVDPFNSAHAMDDGNSNVLIARVAHEMSRIARDTGAAVLVLHHLRKGSNGDVDDLMGATALRANFRNCRVFQRMTEKQAEELGIDDGQRWRYLRIASVKANYAPPPEDCVWFQLASVPLGNGNELYTEGDEIGVAEPWSPPKAFDGIETPILRRIFDKLRGQPEPGWHYGPSSKSKFWAGTVIQDLAGKTETQAKTVLATWKENGVFTEDECTTPGQRNKVKRIVLNEGPISLMTRGSESPDHGI